MIRAVGAGAQLSLQEGDGGYGPHLFPVSCSRARLRKLRKKEAKQRWDDRHWSQKKLDEMTVKVKSESEVAQSCPTLSDPMNCSLPGSSVHGIFQARVLEWGAIA